MLIWKCSHVGAGARLLIWCGIKFPSRVRFSPLPFWGIASRSATAAVLKTVERKSLVGSTPTDSAQAGSEVYLRAGSGSEINLRTGFWMMMRSCFSFQLDKGNHGSSSDAVQKTLGSERYIDRFAQKSHQRAGGSEGAGHAVEKSGVEHFFFI